MLFIYEHNHIIITFSFTFSAAIKRSSMVHAVGSWYQIHMRNTIQATLVIYYSIVKLPNVACTFSKKGNFHKHTNSPTHLHLLNGLINRLVYLRKQNPEHTLWHCSGSIRWAHSHWAQHKIIYILSRLYTASNMEAMVLQMFRTFACTKKHAHSWRTHNQEARLTANLNGTCRTYMWMCAGKTSWQVEMKPFTALVHNKRMNVFESKTIRKKNLCHI